LPDFDDDFAGPRDLARKARAILRYAGAIEHIDLIAGRLAQTFPAFAHDYTTRCARKLAAAIVSERRAAAQQALQKDLALGQCRRKTVHIGVTAAVEERSAAFHMNEDGFKDE
jgi:hypothetical protein